MLKIDTVNLSTDMSQNNKQKISNRAINYLEAILVGSPFICRGQTVFGYAAVIPECFKVVSLRGFTSTWLSLRSERQTC